MTITVRQLEVFAAVARQGSVTRGAQRLHLTQSAASMSLRQLERVLGGPLFARIGRGLVLNDRGRTLLPRVETVLASLDELVELGRGQDAALVGDLVVGCSTTIGNYLMPALIKAFTDVHPRVDLHLRVGNTEEIAAAVRSGAVDGGLVGGEVNDPRLRVETWMRDELVCVTAPGTALATRKHVTVNELATQPWVVREPGSGMRSTVDAAFAAYGLRLASVRELGPTGAVKGAVAAGMGISCLSRAAVARELETGTLAAVHGQLNVDRWFCIVTRSNERPSRLLTTLLEWLRESTS
jgi:DNA-binding transcriptional LysR family regulator